MSQSTSHNDASVPICTPPMSMFTLIAHPYRKIDPSADETKDESQMRMPTLRALLLSIQKLSDFSQFCSAEDDASFAALLGPRSKPGEPRALAELMTSRNNIAASIFNNDAPDFRANLASSKPCIARVQRTVQVLTIEQADALKNPSDRAACVPVQNERAVALLSGQLSSPQPEKIVVTWQRGVFDVKFGRYAPRMVITRAAANSDTSVVLTLHSIEKATHTVTVSNLPSFLLNDVFKPSAVPSSPSFALSPFSVPPIGIVPEKLQLHIAALLQNRMRAHVLVSSAAPDCVSRPLAFNTMKVETRDRKRSTSGMQVTATLHPSSSTCLCRAHNLDPVEMRLWGAKARFCGSSSAMVTLRMCGRELKPGEDCGMHGKNTKRSPLAPDVCCAQCIVDFTCLHDATVSGERDGKRGINIQVPTELNSSTWKELTMLLGAVSKCNNALRASQDQNLVRSQLVAVMNDLEQHITKFSQDEAIPLKEKDKPRSQSNNMTT